VIVVERDQEKNERSQSEVMHSRKMGESMAIEASNKNRIHTLEAETNR